MKNITTTILLFMFSLSPLFAGTLTNLLVDPGFELGTPASGENWTDTLGTPISVNSSWNRTTGTCDHWQGGPKETNGLGDWDGLANGLPAVPEEGGSFVACGSWYPPGERITQHITGAVVGKEYTLTFWYANAGVEGSTTLNTWVKAGVWIDNNEIGVTEALSYLGAENQVWEKASFTYTATSSEFDFTIGMHSTNDIHQDGYSRGYVAFDGAKVIEKSILIADYHFDECIWAGIEGEVKDSSGNNFHGKAINNTTSDTSNGQVNGSGNFVNDNDAITVEGITGITSDNFSISFWTKIGTTENSTHELIKLENVNANNSNNGDGGVIELRYRESDDELRISGEVKQDDGSVNGYSQTVTANLNDDAWHHIVLTYKDENMKIYVDTSDADMIHPSNGVSGVSNLGILDDFNGVLRVGNSINGLFSTKVKIDEVKLYRGVLSDDEISVLHANELAHKNADGTDREEIACLIPFTCTDTMYFSNMYDLTSDTQTNGNMYLHTINREQTPFTFSKLGEGYHVEGSYSNSYYNALAYNPEDNFLYATVKNRLLKIDKNGIVKDLGVIEGLPEVQHFAGTFGHVEADGTAYYYLTQMHDKEIYKIDVKTKTIKETIMMDEAIYTVDMTIDETGENLYFMQRPVFNAPSPNQLMKLNIVNKSVTAIGEAIDGESLVGSTFCDASGRVFVIYDEGGFYEIDTTTGERKPISDAPYMAYLNDGAMCSGATVNLKPTMTIGDATVNEGGNLVFPITLYNNTNPKSFTFKYQAFDGNDSSSKLNATINTDFTAETFPSTIVQELAHDTTIVIPTVQDIEVEADESLRLVLSDITGVLYHGAPIAKGTIRDDDRPITSTCYATTDNYQKLFIYNDLNETDGLADPQDINLTELITGEGGAYRALDGYMYVFSYSTTTDDMDLKKINVHSGEVTDVKKGLLPEHVDAVEFFYDEDAKTDVMYVTDKHGGKFYTIDTTSWSVSSKNIVDTQAEIAKIGALAIDPYSGKIYGVRDQGGFSGTDDTHPILYSLDITGTNVIATKLATLPRVDAEGLAFANDGKLYLETEEVGSGDDEHKIYRLDLQTYTLTKVANTGTEGVTPINTEENNYVDIETLSCDGGVYQAPAIFSIEQKELVVLEGTPQDINKTKELSLSDINITILSNRVIRDDEEIVIETKTIDGTAIYKADYLNLPAEFEMPTGKSSLKISAQLIQADFLAEKDEYFTCQFTVKDNKASFLNDENNVTVTIKDDDKNSFDAWDDNNANVNNRVIRTEIVGKEFTLLFAKINPAGKQVNIDENFGDESNTSYRIIDTNLCDGAYEEDEFTPFSFSANSTPVNMTINQAIKEASVQFYWKDQNGTSKTACSSDIFTIRPNKYLLSVDSNITSGRDFNLTVEAVAYDNHTIVTNYEENATVYLLDANDTNASKGCSFGSFTKKSKNIFTGGIATITLNYNDIGNLKFKVYENNSSTTEFAQVDEGDGLGENNRFIDSVTAEKSIAAAKFIASFAYKTKNGKNYIYYSQNPNIMGAIIDTNITVQNQNGTTVKNFKNGCYAKDVNIELDYSQLGDTSTASFVDDNTTYPSGAAVSGTPKKLKLKVDKRYFDDGNASKRVYMNFGRSPTTTKLPLTISLTKEKSKILGLPDMVNVIDQNISFIYARAHVQNNIEVVGNILNVPITYEVYLPSGVVGSDFGLPLGLAKSVDDRRWSTLPSDGVYLDVDSVALRYPTTGVNISNTATTIQVTAAKTPHKNRAKYKAKEYLKTDTDSFMLNLQSPANTWSGKGKEGKLFDDTASKKTIKRLEW